MVTFLFNCKNCKKRQFHSYTLIKGQDIKFPEITVCEHCGKKSLEIIDIIVMKMKPKETPKFYI